MKDIQYWWDCPDIQMTDGGSLSYSNRSDGHPEEYTIKLREFQPPWWWELEDEILSRYRTKV
jgi:hypothetical protein